MRPAAGTIPFGEACCVARVAYPWGKPIAWQGRHTLGESLLRAGGPFPWGNMLRSCGVPDKRKDLTHRQVFSGKRKIWVEKCLPRVAPHTGKCLREYLAACGGCQV